MSTEMNHIDATKKLASEKIVGSRSDSSETQANIPSMEAAIQVVRAID